MAAIFKMEDSIPMWGDAEAQWLVDNLDIEFSDSDESNVMLRVTRQDAKRLMLEKAKLKDDEEFSIIYEVNKLLEKAGTEYIDLLVRW